MESLFMYSHIPFLLITSTIILSADGFEMPAFAASANQVPLQSSGLAFTSTISAAFIVFGAAGSRFIDTAKRLLGLGVFLSFLGILFSQGIHDIHEDQKLWLLCLPLLAVGYIQLVNVLLQWTEQRPRHDSRDLGDEDSCRGCEQNPCVCGAASGNKDYV